MAKTYFVVRGGREMVCTTDQKVAFIIANGVGEKIHTFSNYHLALKMLQKMVDSGLHYSKKPDINDNYIHLDCSVNNKTGTAEFRVMQGEKILIAGTSLEHCTPNLAEFIALVEAHKYREHFKIDKEIYCDNRTSLDWFRGDSEIQIPPTVVAANPKLVHILTDAIAYSKSATRKTDVLLWDKSMYGEIPSDFGRKKVIYE